MYGRIFYIHLRESTEGEALRAIEELEKKTLRSVLCASSYRYILAAQHLSVRVFLYRLCRYVEYFSSPSPSSLSSEARRLLHFLIFTCYQYVLSHSRDFLFLASALASASHTSRSLYKASRVSLYEPHGSFFLFSSLSLMNAFPLPYLGRC